MWTKHVQSHQGRLLTHFWPMFPFYTPLKTPENQRFSGVFRGYKMGTLARNGLKNTKAMTEGVFHFVSCYFHVIPN